MRDLFSTFNRLIGDCAASDLSIDAQVTALELSWLVLAENERALALSTPGGFLAVQARQLDHLEKMVLVVRDASSDVEAERLFQQGDWERLLEHYRRLGLDDHQDRGD